MLHTLRYLLLTPLLAFMLLTQPMMAKEMTQQERNEMAAKLIPIITMLLMDDGDTVAPVKPSLTTDAPTSTLDESVPIEVNGEAGSRVFVNGVYVATVTSTGKVTISLNLTDGTNAFSIVLKDSSGNTSEVLSFNISMTDTSIVVQNGTMQKIPFDFTATVANLPSNHNVQWYVDGNATGNTAYTIDEEGTYYVTAKVMDASNQVVKVLHTDIVAYDTKLVTSFTAKEANETSTYVYADRNSTLSGVSLTIQKGSVLQDTLIELKGSKAANIPNLGRSAISKVLTLEPAGLQFEKPILVSVPYEGNISKENIVIARYSDGGVVDTILPYSVDEESKIVTFKTEHFTSFSLQHGWNLIDDPIYEQSEIQRIIELTQISGINTNKEWEDILNSVIVEKGDYRVYDMFLEYDKQKRMSDEISAGHYAQAIKIMLPNSKNSLEEEIESLKSIINILDYANTALSFDPRQIVAGGVNMASEIISAIASLNGYPTSVYDIADVDNYAPKPVDIYASVWGEVQDTIFSGFWHDLDDEYFGGEDGVMAYDASTGTMSSFMGNGAHEFTKDMIHNLKLIYLKNKHFKQYGSTYLSNLIETIKYYHKSENKSVIVRPSNNHMTSFVSSVDANFYPKFKAKPTGYSQDSFLTKNPRVTLSYHGTKLGILNFNDKDEKGSYITGYKGIASFDTAGKYVLDWKYNDSEGVERNGKYYVEFVEPYMKTITDYTIKGNHITNINGYIKAVPIFGSDDNYIDYETEITIGSTKFTQEYKTGIKIPNYADILAGKLGDDKKNEMRNAKIKFMPKKSSIYTFEAKEFTVDLLAYALKGDGGVFDNIWIDYDVDNSEDPVAPATIRLEVNNILNGVEPLAIDYDRDGIYDKRLNINDVNEYGILEIDALYTKKGDYKPCVRLMYKPAGLYKRICREDYVIRIGGIDEPVITPIGIPEITASRTDIKIRNTITLTFDLEDVDTLTGWDLHTGGSVLAEGYLNENTQYFIKVQYLEIGVFSPYVDVTLTDGSKVKLKSNIIKVGEATTGTITHNGTTYGTVTSPHTNKVWLDRNLGASQVCTSFNDTACYGDYYQWGRNYDGHQGSTSSTTSTQATDVNSAGSSFVKSNSDHDYDWAKNADSDGSLRSANWGKTDGTSVCPVGYRVPDIDELKAELFDTGSAQIQNRDDAFDSFLKLPSAGYRSYYSGALGYQGSWGGVWSSSVYGSYSHDVYFSSDDASSDNRSRADGFAVRCLRD